MIDVVEIMCRGACWSTHGMLHGCECKSPAACENWSDWDVEITGSLRALHDVGLGIVACHGRSDRDPAWKWKTGENPTLDNLIPAALSEKGATHDRQ